MREEVLELAAVPSGVAAAGTPDGTAPTLRAASSSQDGLARETGAGDSAGKRFAEQVQVDADGHGGEAAAHEGKRPDEVRTGNRNWLGSGEIESQPGKARIGELGMAEQAKGNTGGEIRTPDTRIMIPLL